MTRNQVILVDEADQRIGVAEKLNAHQTGMLHRAFSIFITRTLNNQVELLLQQRAYTKYHCGGLWSNTCCSHPQPEEELLESALKRIQEELGICLLHLDKIAEFSYRIELNNGLIEHEFDHIFVAHLMPEQLKSLSVILNPDEVAAVKWVSLEWLQQDILQNSEQYTPWFIEIFKNIANRLAKAN